MINPHRFMGYDGVVEEEPAKSAVAFAIVDDLEGYFTRGLWHHFG